MNKPIRVLIVDDSRYVRLVLKRMLGTADDIEVVGIACNGCEALELVPKLKPDVITLDIEMPHVTGLQVLERLLPRYPIPVIMLSSLTQEGADVTLRALELGAVDFVGKPGSAGVPNLAAVETQLIGKVRSAAGARVRIRKARRGSANRPIAKMPTITLHKPTVLIASSTGGPGTLDQLLSALPAGLPAAFAITQHMPRGFTRSLAARLDSTCALKVIEAEEGTVLRPGTIAFAPGDYHMVIGPQGIVHLSQDPPKWGVRPAADYMMESAAQNLHCPLVGVVLTGMGCDGAEGLVALKASNATVIAQDEESSVIYGMPKAAAETGVCDYIASLSEMPSLLTNEIVALATGR